MTRDGRATLKLVARNGMTGQLAIQVTNETFSIRLLRGEQVRYEVESVSEERGTIEIQLMFADPSNVSNKMVSNANLSIFFRKLTNLRFKSSSISSSKMTRCMLNSRKDR